MQTKNSAGSKTFWRSISLSPHWLAAVYNVAHPPSLLTFSSFLLHVDNTSVCPPLPFGSLPQMAKLHSHRADLANNLCRRIISIVFVPFSWLSKKPRNPPWLMSVYPRHPRVNTSGPLALPAKVAAVPSLRTRFSCIESCSPS